MRTKEKLSILLGTIIILILFSFVPSYATTPPAEYFDKPWNFSTYRITDKGWTEVAQGWTSVYIAGNLDVLEDAEDWTGPDGEDVVLKYVYYKSTKKKGTYKAVKTTKDDYYTAITGLKPLKKYYFKIKCYADDKYMGTTPIVSVKMRALQPKTRCYTSDSKTLTYTVRQGYIGTEDFGPDRAEKKHVQIYRKVGKKGKWKKVKTKTITKGAYSYTVKTKNTKTTYYFKSRFYKKVGKKTYYSKWSHVHARKAEW